MPVIKFALDTTALEGRANDATTVAYHRQLLRAWRNHGCLVHDKSCKAQLKKLLDNLPHELKRAWVEAFKHAYRTEVPSASPDLTQVEDAAAFANCLFDVACLEETRSLILGLAEDAISHDLHHVELVRYQHLSESNAYLAAAETALASIPKGTTAQDVWDTRFAPLTNVSQSITIVDRYLSAQIYEVSLDEANARMDAANGRQPRRRRDCGLRNVLHNLDQEVSTPSTVTIYSTDAKDNQDISRGVHDWVRDFVSKLSRGGVRRVQYTTCPDRAFRDLAHDRFMSIGNHVIEIGTGLNVFEGKQAGRNTTCTVKHRQRMHEDITKALKAKGTRTSNTTPGQQRP